MFEFKNRAKVDLDEQEDDLSDNSNLSQFSNINKFKQKYPNIQMNRAPVPEYNEENSLGVGNRISRGYNFYQELGSINNRKLPKEKKKRNKSEFTVAR